MSPKITSIFWCIITLIATVPFWLQLYDFFQVSFQVTCLMKGKVAKVTFVRFVPSVNFQICPKSLNRGKITIFAFEGFFTNVNFQMLPQTPCSNRGKYTYHLYEFLCVSLNALPELLHNHITCICMISLLDIQVTPQLVCSNRCKVTLTTFVQFFSAVSF